MKKYVATQITCKNCGDVVWIPNSVDHTLIKHCTKCHASELWLEREPVFVVELDGKNKKKDDRDVNYTPKHYDFKIQPRAVIQEWDLPYDLGVAVSYIARCQYKGEQHSDLLKAIHHLKMYIRDYIKEEEKK